MESTFHGLISSTEDAMLIFECIHRGIMPRVKRRLRENEQNRIRSGQVFVYDESQSRIKKWKDGRLWSPGRAVNDFMVYRELEESDVQDIAGCSHWEQSSQESRSVSPNFNASADSWPNSVGVSSSSVQLALEMADSKSSLGGQFRSKYQFRKGGLIKKTFSMRTATSTQHLISYYTLEELFSGILLTPSSLPYLSHLMISPQWSCDSFDTKSTWQMTEDNYSHEYFPLTTNTSESYGECASPLEYIAPSFMAQNSTSLAIDSRLTRTKKKRSKRVRKNACIRVQKKSPLAQEISCDTDSMDEETCADMPPLNLDMNNLPPKIMNNSPTVSNMPTAAGNDDRNPSIIYQYWSQLQTGILPVKSPTALIPSSHLRNGNSERAIITSQRSSSPSLGHQLQPVETMPVQHLDNITMELPLDKVSATSLNRCKTMRSGLNTLGITMSTAAQSQPMISSTNVPTTVLEDINSNASSFWHCCGDQTDSMSSLQSMLNSPRFEQHLNKIAQYCTSKAEAKASPTLPEMDMFPFPTFMNSQALDGAQAICMS